MDTNISKDIKISKDTGNNSECNCSDDDNYSYNGSVIVDKY